LIRQSHEAYFILITQSQELPHNTSASTKFISRAPILVAFNATSVRDAIVTCYACQVFSSFAPSLLDVSNLDVMYLGIGAKTYQYSMWLGPCP